MSGSTPTKNVDAAAPPARRRPPPPLPDWYTPVSSIGPIVERIRSASASRVAHPLPWRKAQLLTIIRMIEENDAAIRKAFADDMNFNDFLTFVETNGTIAEARFALDRLDSWTSDESVPTPFPTNLTTPVRSVVRKEPRGVALIVGPWNYPLNLVVIPLIGAIAAGCCAIIKPSELSVNFGRLLVELIPRYLDEEAVAVVTGGKDETAELLTHRFDAICYTGSTSVGRIVAKAAARFLTPTLLEMGGQNPTIVCEDADVPTAALRIMWGKFSLNMGQTCLCPDYVLVVESLKDRLVEEFVKVLKDYYGERPRESKDVGRIISVKHAERVSALIDGTCHVLHGGKFDVNDRYVEPTLVEATSKSTVLQDEVFGPILSIIAVPSVDGAIRFVNEKSAGSKHPLALYVFAKGKANQQKVIDGIKSGLVCVNDCVKSFGNPDLPFGGIGESGLGSYHGKRTFDFFTQERALFVLDNHVSSRWDPAVWMTYPPYSERSVGALRMLSKVPLVVSKLRFAMNFGVIPALMGYVVYARPDVVEALCEFNVNAAIALLVRGSDWVRSALLG